MTTDMPSSGKVYRRRTRWGRPLFALLFGIGGAPAIEAHDFWVQPNEYWAVPNAQTALTLQVGHGPFRQRSPIPLRRIIRFEAIAPSGVSLPLRNVLHLGEGSGDGDLILSDAGTYVVALQTDNRAQVHLPAIRFNDYLRAEGLTPAIMERERRHRMEVDGSEIYSRCAKMLMQIGPLDDQSQAQASRPLGLPLEIVPERNPYAMPPSSTLAVRVLLEGEPLAGALVKFTRLEHDEVPVDAQVTDRAGGARFAMPTTGSWLLSVVWTKALPRTSETDFETTFSSLSFGFPQASAGAVVAR
jgi:hypothetical protein